MYISLFHPSQNQPVFSSFNTRRSIQLILMWSPFWYRVPLLIQYWIRRRLVLFKQVSFCFLSHYRSFLKQLYEFKTCSSNNSEIPNPAITKSTVTMLCPWYHYQVQYYTNAFDKYIFQQCHTFSVYLWPKHIWNLCGFQRKVSTAMLPHTTCRVLQWGTLVPARSLSHLDSLIFLLSAVLSILCASSSTLFHRRHRQPNRLSTFWICSGHFIYW